MGKKIFSQFDESFKEDVFMFFKEWGAVCITIN